MSNECQCGKPTRDSAYLCDGCTEQLSRALGEIPWLTEELEVSITNQKGVDYRSVGSANSGKPSEAPSPVSWGPAEARTHLKSLLVSWTLFCASEGIRSGGASPELPADDLIALSRWMMHRVNGLALNDISPDAHDEITSAVAHCHRLIDRPAERQYLGTCTMCESGRLYARAGSKWARCDECESGIEASTIRERLLAELEDRLCTAAEIARLSTYLGLRADREQVRKRINQWASRERIVQHASISDQATFRFGDVYAMLLVSEYEPRKAAS